MLHLEAAAALQTSTMLMSGTKVDSRDAKEGERGRRGEAGERQTCIRKGDCKLGRSNGWGVERHDESIEWPFGGAERGEGEIDNDEEENRRGKGSEGRRGCRWLSLVDALLEEFAALQWRQQ